MRDENKKETLDLPSGGQLDKWQIEAITQNTSKNNLEEYLIKNNWPKEDIKFFIKFMANEEF